MHAALCWARPDVGMCHVTWRTTDPRWYVSNPAYGNTMMHRNKAKGFTIVEVLVSLLILSIGVLALGVLQIASIQNTQGGYMRTQATFLAYDMIDSMRANIPAVTNGNYNLTFATATPALSCS